MYASTFPIYTDKKAPGRIADELYPKGNLSQSEMNARFDQWFLQLRTYETPYKRLSDLGRGLCAAGLGLLLATYVWVAYHKFSWMRTTRAIFLLWLALWAMRIPLSVWYYVIRALRFDYPSWGDSIGIGIFTDWLSWVIGAAVSSLILASLLWGRKLPEKITFAKPRSTYDWLRTLFFAAWMAILVEGIAFGIPAGDEGAVLTPIVAPIILLAVLYADKAKSGDGMQPASDALAPAKA